ncbi:MAG TPA: hypothetical protein VKY27_08035 [Bacteriovoracaceae bacterium]|nr:hypothetical protein [Bacteriovoracaceae bacterium]
MKSLTFLLFCLPFFAAATSTLEEGIILQNELRFLEEVSQAEFQATNPRSSESTLNSSNDLDLESTYFNETSDMIQTRSSAPRRRAP